MMWRDRCMFERKNDFRFKHFLSLTDLYQYALKEEKESRLVILERMNQLDKNFILSIKRVDEIDIQFNFLESSKMD